MIILDKRGLYVRAARRRMSAPIREYPQECADINIRRRFNENRVVGFNDFRRLARYSSLRDVKSSRRLRRAGIFK